MAITLTETQTTAAVSSTSQLRTLWAQDPMSIIVMLFDKSLLHISRAKASLTGWGDDSYQASILRAVDVLEQLQNTLDHESEAAMAAHLNDLYHYVSRQLINSIHDQDMSALTSASTLLVEIRESLSIFVKKTPRLLQH